jgi:16S rRNA (uracil1498-N3)-methyltransferase
VFLAGASLAGTAPGRTLTLDGPEGRHAAAVRRLRVGEDIVLTDGAGTGALGTVAAVEGRDSLRVTVTEVRHEPAPRPRLVVVQALPKGDRGETAVETMTETGVDVVVPWAAARCVTQWRGERGQKALGRWRATAREAAKQARRLRVPEIAEPATTRDVARLLSGAAFAGVLHESADRPLAAAPLPAEGDLVLVVGPEGGIAPDELTAFADAGAGVYRLGPTVLRTSTAGTAAAAVLLSRTGRWS